MFYVKSENENQYFSYTSKLTEEYKNIQLDLNNKNIIELKPKVIRLYSEVNKYLNISKELLEIEQCENINDLSKVIDELEYSLLVFINIKQDIQVKEHNFYNFIILVISIYSIILLIIFIIALKLKNYNSNLQGTEFKRNRED